jgi:tripartite-type tricarboxylate transporter receptor subunit TctC
MKLPRRNFLRLAAAAAALPAVARIAWAQAYPTRPVRWIIPFPPGGGADIVSRIMASWLSDRLGQPIIIESKPGGGTNIGTQTVVNSPPDGYTLLLYGSSAAINATFYATLPFNLQRDIAPVAGLVDLRLALVAHPSVPAQTVVELIAYAKAHPGKINIDEAVPGYEATVWTGVGAPRGTPLEIIERLNREINAGLANPTIKARLAEVATTPKIFTPAKFGDHVVAEIEKWGRVIKFAGIRAE